MDVVVVFICLRNKIIRIILQQCVNNQQGSDARSMSAGFTHKGTSAALHLTNHTHPEHLDNESTILIDFNLLC